jgi:hypothetical protein
VADGQTNREIAAALGVGAETVTAVLARTFPRLGVRRRAEAVATRSANGSYRRFEADALRQSTARSERFQRSTVRPC